MTRWLLVALAIGLVLAVACSDGDSEEPSPATTPTVEVTAVPTVGRTPALAPFATPRPLVPPLETAPSTSRVTERTNYWEDPTFQLPDPDSLPEPSDDLQGLEFRPPAEPDCPQGWTLHDRQSEFFKLCYPPDWQIDGHGYWSLPNEDDRSYVVGFFDFLPNGLQTAHVSVYVAGPYSQPNLIMKECSDPYRVVLDDRPAALCADFLGNFPEARIIQYYVPGEFVATFINIVAYFQYDEETDSFSDQLSDEDLETAIQIAQTVQFYDSPFPDLTPTVELPF